MLEKPKLSEVHKGYALVNFKLGWGYVQTEKFVVRTDFEKDEILYTERWVPRLYRREGSLVEYIHVGRLTGYKTRKEAIEALREAIGKRKS